jgi:hypothetical protein
MVCAYDVQPGVPVEGLGSGVESLERLGWGQLARVLSREV